MSKSVRKVKSPGKQGIWKMADQQDRLQLFKHALKHVPVGTRRIADAPKVGPANTDKCKLAVDMWDKAVQNTADGEICKGFFFFSFGKKHSFRKCESAAKGDLCNVCKEIREVARKHRAAEVHPRSDFYHLENKAVFSRRGVLLALEFWDKEVLARRRADKLDKKLSKDYPGFSAKEMVEMVMMEGKVWHKDAKKRAYKRSAGIVQAQDEHLRACASFMLKILQKETKTVFLRRWREIVKAASIIHEVMHAENANSDTQEVGAIQAPDVV